MLGGVYWPIDMVPDLMQKIALGVPQTWAMAGFKEIISAAAFQYPIAGFPWRYLVSRLLLIGLGESPTSKFKENFFK